MRTLSLHHRNLIRLVIVVAAVAAFAIPQLGQAAAKAGSGAGKGKTPTATNLDISTSVSDLADPVRLGGEVTYRVVVSNVGSATANNAYVSVEIDGTGELCCDVDDPRGTVVYSSVTPTKGSCFMARHGLGSELPLLDHSALYFFGYYLDLGWMGGNYYSVGRGSSPFCKIPTLAAGETSTIDVVVRPTYPSRDDDPSRQLRADAYHYIIRQGCYGACPSADGNPQNDRDWETTTITSGSDVADCTLTGPGTGSLGAPCAAL